MTAISKYVNDSMWEVSRREMGQGWRSGEGVTKDSPEEAILKLRPEVSWSVSRAWLKEQQAGRYVVTDGNGSEARAE